LASHVVQLLLLVLDTHLQLQLLLLQVPHLVLGNTGAALHRVNSTQGQHYTGAALHWDSITLGQHYTGAALHRGSITQGQHYTGAALHRGSSTQGHHYTGTTRDIEL